jgi:hypothetical protein
LKSLRISIVLAPELVDLREAFLRRTAQPILQVLPDLRVIVHIVDLYDLANHSCTIAVRSRFCNGFFLAA